MKIAIMYSGAIRQLLHSLRNNLLAFDYADTIDLYFSTWDHIGYVDKLNSPDYITYPKSFPFETVVSEELIRDIVSYCSFPSIIKSKINIKAIKIETYNNQNYKLDLINKTDNIGLHAQYYKIWDCFNLLQDDYDLLVRCRCDLLLNNFDKDTILNNVLDNKIVFPSKIWYNHPWTTDSRTINEMIWISNKNLMKKACNIYNNTDNINQIIKQRRQKEKNYGESITFLNLEAENLIDNIATFDFNYNVLR